MKIAKIVSSNSHVDYVARIIDSMDVADPPDADDYGFGQLVTVGLGDNLLVGAIYNSMLVNPDYASYGPRLSDQTELKTFSPDFLDEQGALVAIILLGTLGQERAEHAIPTPVIPAGVEVENMLKDDVVRFHTGEKGGFSLKYYGHVLSHVGAFGIPLLENIIERLIGFDECSEEDRSKLSVLRRSLVWQRTVGQMRL